MHFGTEPKIADVAASLLAAWESGDRVRLERAVQEASSDLSAGVHGSLHMSELRELLLGTGHRELVEASPFDHYWGCGADGSGQNRLGRLLMKIREEFRSTTGAGSPHD